MFVLKRGARHTVSRALGARAFQLTAKNPALLSLPQHASLIFPNEELMSQKSSFNCHQGVDGQTRSFSSKRRKRPAFGYALDDDNTSDVFAYNLNEGFTPGEDNIEDYLEKASLSPWVPLPESAFRKYFDLAPVEPGDIHVDLGCGDGRVNFFAHDYAGVEKSTGIDIDEAILKIAHERLAKRHPPPKNLQFIQADLLDANHPAWKEVQEATIITMFFVKDALSKLRPILERKLVGKKCRILTAGYPMPTWHSYMSEVVLGTQIYLYKWGYDDEEHGEIPIFNDDFMLDSRPEELESSPMENHLSQSDQFSGYDILDESDEPKTYEEQQRIETEYWDRQELQFDEHGQLIENNEDELSDDEDEDDDDEKESKPAPKKRKKKTKSIPPEEESEAVSDEPLYNYVKGTNTAETKTLPNEILRRQGRL